MTAIKNTPWTPGPWTIGRQGKNRLHINTTLHREFAGVYTRMEGGVPIPDGLANARLIAAAPQMADALMAAYLSYDAWDGASVPIDQVASALRAAGAPMPDDGE